ncbi:hypothetical protein CVU76_01630 [Candidatus Dojkabacteria bacterium HGW-Dojkabacteria-1]|uniref:Uncharacterized protein n=1 Tax=Candidatus Dojkabacteria bacterium HGW-Dojkabacteria-1 TaxID=2013761 RepID=A0A2N2F3I4_9BACT|nr:MAG: hypothetical protein CVU76_01630 [Candidatus Dojkabacteria bacterium HGW-Dojkabacteria-1]
MHRGMLYLTNEETRALLGNVDLNKYQGTPLFNKLSCLIENPDHMEDCKVLLSEEEVETILDEIGFVDETENPQLAYAVKKVMELMSSFRE